METNIYDIENKVNRAIELTKLDKNLTSKNKRLILRIHQELRQQNLGLYRQLIYIQKMRTNLKGMKDIEKLTTKQILNHFTKVCEGHNEGGKELLKTGLIKILRTINKKDCLEALNKIKIKSKLRIPEILTRDDLNLLLKNTNNIRDRVLIYMLYESGFRISELLNIKIKDLEFCKEGVRVSVLGKTGSRRILLVEVQGILSNWLELHPDNKPESYLFVNLTNKERLKYPATTRVLNKTKERAKLNKKTNAHIFRHSRATELAKYFNEYQLCQYFGWFVGSKTPRVYVHLSGKSLDESILRLHNNNTNHNVEIEVHTKVCLRCKEINPLINNFCCRCGLPLNFKPEDLLK